MDYSEFFTTVVTAGGGGAFIAFVAFRFLAISWLDNKFDQKLENYRHQNAKELAALRASVDGALSKTVKSQEKEFEAISEMWRLANIAHGTLGGFVNPFQSYSDVKRMSDQKLREYLAQYDFLPSIVEEIMDSSDRMEEFVKAVFWHKRNRCNNALNELQNFVYLNEVFVEENVASEFKWISREMGIVFVSREIAEEEGMGKERRSSHKKFTDEISPRLEAMAPILRDKFFERV